MADETRDRVLTRLRRIGGQVEGLQRMIRDERYCVDVLLQVAAAQAALDRVGKIVLESHVETCVASALASGNRREGRRKLDELMDVFSRFGHIRAR
jgi:DNA-binding FrmR family transcriptional regulator